MGIEHKHAYRFVYLKSDEWQNVRLEALVREEGKCQICGCESVFNDAHHVVYPKSFWDTETRHLVILCRPCHNVAHAFISNKQKSDSDKWSEWNHLVSVLKEWQRDKIEWLKDSDEMHKSIHSTKKSKQPKMKLSDQWCFCCHIERQDTESVNIVKRYEKEIWWNICPDCFAALQLNIEWPESYNGVMDMVRIFKIWHLEIIVALSGGSDTSPLVASS
jgi:hypothetical protein